MLKTQTVLALLTIALSGGVAGCVATVHPGPGHHPPRPHDHPGDGEVAPLAGWRKLGERVVNGPMDHDVIAVGAEDGRFARVRFVVEGSALEMYGIVITFGDGSTFSPPTRLVFERMTMTREIDLPGDRRVIRRIDLRYGNLPGGGRARVEAWAQ